MPGRFRPMVVPRGRLERGYILHLTSIENVVPIFEAEQLTAQSLIPASQSVDELGSVKIKDLRRDRPVPLPPEETVGAYVPFYFSARSPMLYFAHRGNHPLCPFTKGQGELVHLVSHVEIVDGEGRGFVFTDRNAAKAYAEFSNDLDDLDNLVDWTLQNQTHWNNTEAQPERMERRMAEFLVHKRLPTDSLVAIATLNEAQRDRVSDLLATYDHPQVTAQPDWYY